MTRAWLRWLGLAVFVVAPGTVGAQADGRDASRDAPAIERDELWIPPNDAPTDGEAQRRPVHTSWSRVTLRAGNATSEELGVASVCAEVRIWRQLAVESCGTGSELWREGQAGEMMHVRAHWELAAWRAAGGRLGVRMGAGFAEMTIGDDELGFQFGSPAPDDPISVAGPEAAASAQWALPLGHTSLEFIANATLGAAYFSGAPSLREPRDRLQPFAAFELGVGW